ncbi:MAG TPA: response regulator transcription factor [Chitinophagaceae bacterium]|jgi:DNA-binding NarL/FixJ family response regulator|nr:response regulator transcription factor [Chitinophagaceae bacterium]
MDDKEMELPLLQVLIVDDYPMVREGINLMLRSPNKFYRFEVDEAESGEEAIKKVIHSPFQVVIIDYEMPEMCGHEVIETMLRYNSTLKILTISHYDQLAYINKMMDAGASGYVLKNIEPPELFRAIRTIMSGNNYFSNEVAVKLLNAPGKDSVHQLNNRYNLSKRELEVLKLIAEGRTNDEIARNLSLAKRTVDTHRQRLLNKVQARNTADLTRVAFELRLVRVPD